MADNNKAVGALAAAKLVALIKSVTAKKYDKTGGKIDGSAEITGGLKVGMSSEFSSSIKAGSEISSDMLLMAPIVALYDPAKEESISFGVSGENAAKVTSNVSGGGVQYARLAVGTPTGDNDAATKAYVDAAAGATVYVDFWPTSSEDEYDKDLKAYVIDLAASQTYDTIFDSINAGNKTIARFYSDETKTKLLGTSADVLTSGDNALGIINFQFIRVNVTDVAGFHFIGETIMLIKTSSGTSIFLVSGDTALPVPNSDGTDNGKVPTINGKKWELKKPESTTTVDDAMSSTSTNPVQNKTIKQYVDDNAVSLPLTLTYANGQATGAAYTDIRKAIERGRQIKLSVANTIDIIASNARNETNKSVLMFTNTDVGGDTVNISQYTVTAQASGLTCNVKSHELA